MHSDSPAKATPERGLTVAIDAQPVAGGVVHPIFPHSGQLCFRLNKKAPAEELESLSEFQRTTDCWNVVFAGCYGTFQGRSAEVVPNLCVNLCVFEDHIHVPTVRMDPRGIGTQTQPIGGAVASVSEVTRSINITREHPEVDVSVPQRSEAPVGSDLESAYILVKNPTYIVVDSRAAAEPSEPEAPLALPPPPPDAFTDDPAPSVDVAPGPFATIPFTPPELPKFMVVFVRLAVPEVAVTPTPLPGKKFTLSVR